MNIQKRAGLCMAIGLLLAIGTAFICYIACLRPTERGRHEFSPDQVACYAGDGSWLATLPLEFPKYSELSNDCGFGFRQITLLLPTSLQTNPPTYTAQHLLTTLGWPQPIFSSGSDWLASTHFHFPTRGHTFPVEIHPNLVPQTNPSATTLHWSGIIFDTITFGLPVLAFMMMTTTVISRTGVWLRRAVLIVTASWWIAIALPSIGMFTLFHTAQGNGENDEYSFRIIPSAAGQQIIPYAHEEWHPVVTDGEQEPDTQLTYKFKKVSTASDEWMLDQILEMQAIQCDPPLCDFAVSWRQHLHKSPHLKFTVRIGDVVVAGWPVRAFSKGDGTFLMFVNDLSQLDVQWLAWLANVTVLSSGLAIICYPVGIIRRWRRVAPGQCTTCRYPLNGSAICSECGRANAGSVKN